MEEAVEAPSNVEVEKTVERNDEEEENGREDTPLETDEQEDQPASNADLEADIDNESIDQGHMASMLPDALKDGSGMIDEVGEWSFHSLLLFTFKLLVFFC